LTAFIEQQHLSFVSVFGLLFSEGPLLLVRLEELSRRNIEEAAYLARAIVKFFKQTTSQAEGFRRFFPASEQCHVRKYLLVLLFLNHFEDDLLHEVSGSISLINCKIMIYHRSAQKFRQFLANYKLQQYLSEIGQKY
jgi:hypothetical protein